MKKTSDFVLGWFACKEEVLKLLKQNTYKFEKGEKNNPAACAIEMIGLHFKEEIENLEVNCCFHKNTWVENGIRTCKDCDEQLEVTSFRD